jgi:hypothetical protein
MWPFGSSVVVGGILILLLNDSPDPEEADGAQNAFLELFL